MSRLTGSVHTGGWRQKYGIQQMAETAAAPLYLRMERIRKMDPLITAHSVRDLLLQRVRAEYSEMPGLGLTLAQAARFWTLDRATCAALLETLVSTKFLTRTNDGTYIRRDGARAG